MEQMIIPTVKNDVLAAATPGEMNDVLNTDMAIETLMESVEADAPTEAPQSLEDLYNQHYRRVYSLCLRMTANPADAEDLAHDVFIQLQRKLSSFRGESAFTTWLHRITVNQVLMHFRKKSFRSESVTEDGEMPEMVVPSSSKPSAMPIIDRIALLNAVEQLPRGYRMVFIMHDLQGYEHEEIGEKLGISAGTSKSQLHKARMRMRELLMKKADTVTVGALELNLAEL